MDDKKYQPAPSNYVAWLKSKHKYTLVFVICLVSIALFLFN